MRRFCPYILLAWCMIVITLYLAKPSPVLAQRSDTSSKMSGTESAQKENPFDASGVDIVMLLDCSGKMKQIDPHDYRKPAAKLFIDLLEADDGVSIIGFGDSAREISPLIRNSSSNREKLYRGIDNITAKEFNTNITEAIATAFAKLKSSTRKNRVIILLSDGTLDLGSPGKSEKSYKELKKLLPDIMKAGIKVHAIAFTQLAEMDLLTEIATETGGSATLVKSDKDLHITFASIFEKIKSPDSLPLSGDSFLVDKSIQETILLITKKPGTHTEIFDPLKHVHSLLSHGENITWHESSAFDMITIVQPEAGTWRIRLSSSEGNRIFIVTDLKLKGFFGSDTTVVGEKIKIDAWLEKQTMILRDSEFLDHVILHAEFDTPDGKSSRTDLIESGPSRGIKDKTGIFTGEADIRITGDYRITITAEGKTFKREKSYQIRALERLSADAENKQATQGIREQGPQPIAIEWKSVLIAFGSVNLLLAGIGILIYTVCYYYKKMVTATRLATPKRLDSPTKLEEKR